MNYDLKVFINNLPEDKAENSFKYINDHLLNVYMEFTEKLFTEYLNEIENGKISILMEQENLMRIFLQLTQRNTQMKICLENLQGIYQDDKETIDLFAGGGRVQRVAYNFNEIKDTIMIKNNNYMKHPKVESFIHFPYLYFRNLRFEHEMDNLMKSIDLYPGNLFTIMHPCADKANHETAVLRLLDGIFPSYLEVIRVSSILHRSSYVETKPCKWQMYVKVLNRDKFPCPSYADGLGVPVQAITRLNYLIYPFSCKMQSVRINSYKEAIWVFEFNTNCRCCYG